MIILLIYYLNLKFVFMFVCFVEAVQLVDLELVYLFNVFVSIITLFSSKLLFFIVNLLF